MSNETKQSDSSPEPTEYQWTTPSGKVVRVPYETIATLARIDRVFPGARCVFYRTAGGEWCKNVGR